MSNYKDLKKISLKESLSKYKIEILSDRKREVGHGLIISIVSSLVVQI